MSDDGAKFSSLLLVLGNARLQRLPLTAKWPAFGVLHLIESKGSDGTVEEMLMQCSSLGAICVANTTVPWVGDYVFVGRILQHLFDVRKACMQDRSHSSSSWPTWLRKLHKAVGCRRITHELSGVLYTHMDFFVRPSFVSSLRASVPWRLHHGVIGHGPPRALRARLPLKV